MANVYINYNQTTYMVQQKKSIQENIQWNWTILFNELLNKSVIEHVQSDQLEIL